MNVDLLMKNANVETLRYALPKNLKNLTATLYTRTIWTFTAAIPMMKKSAYNAINGDMKSKKLNTLTKRAELVR